MSVPICHHLKEDGVYCGSPALKGRDYCYFHLNLQGRRLKAARARRRGDNPPLDLPAPEDMHAVQLSLAEILWALAEQRLDHKTASLMLRTLQHASTNLNRTPRWQGERNAVESSRPLRALSDPGFEQRFADPPEELTGGMNDDTGSPLLSSVGGPHLPDVGKCGTDADGSNADGPNTNHSSPDCVPIPLPGEKEHSSLKMTQAEQMGFFNYRMSCNTTGDEDKLKLIWLCAKRAGMLTQTEEDRDFSAAYEAMFPKPADSDEEAA